MRSPNLIAAAVMAVAITAAGAARPASDSLVGYESTEVAHVPEQTPGRSGEMTLTAKTTILAVTPQVLKLRYDTVVTHQGGGVFRRAVSDVTVPLAAVTLQRSSSGLQFACNDRSGCMSWTHVAWYDENGANFGPAGTADTYGLILTEAGTTRLATGLCPLTHCA